jgi:hypothetical protein
MIVQIRQIREMTNYLGFGDLRKSKWPLSNVVFRQARSRLLVHGNVSGR